MKHKITIDQFTSVSDFVNALVADGQITFGDPEVNFYNRGDPLSIDANTQIFFKGFAESGFIVIQRSEQTFSSDPYDYAFWVENTEEADTGSYQKFMDFIAKNYCNNSDADADAFFTALSDGYVFMGAANSLMKCIPE